MIFIFWLLGYILCIALYIIWLKYICRDDVETKKSILESTLVDILMLSSLSWIAIGFIIFILIFIATLFIISGLVNLIKPLFKKLLNYIIFNENKRN